jgi:uncharacterized membrane protein YdcZ (DUF606 family)
VVGGLSARTEPKPVLLVLLVFAGFCFAGQQAVNARLRPDDRAAARRRDRQLRGRRGGAHRGHIDRGRRRAADGWSAPPLDWIGGLLGAAFVISVGPGGAGDRGVAAHVGAVAGQSAGALVLDVVAPAPGEAVTVGTVVGVGSLWARWP